MGTSRYGEYIGMIPKPNRRYSELEFEYRNFDDTSLTGTEFVNCTFRNSSFLRCDLRLTKFIGCNFSDTAVTNSNFRYSEFENCKIQATFNYCVLQQATLVNCSLSHCLFYGSSFWAAKFIDTNFINTTFDKTKLDETTWQNCNQYKVEFWNNLVSREHLFLLTLQGVITQDQAKNFNIIS